VKFKKIPAIIIIKETTEIRDYAAAAVLLIAFYAIIIGLILIVGKII